MVPVHPIDKSRASRRDPGSTPVACRPEEKIGLQRPSPATPGDMGLLAHAVPPAGPSVIAHARRHAPHVAAHFFFTLALLHALLFFVTAPLQ